MTFELLEHEADIGFRARGATLQDLFVNCARALVAMILDDSRIRPLDEVTVSAIGSDYESLLVNWLNEVLYWADGRRVAFGGFEVLRLEESFLECAARGERRNEEMHPARRIVKAVTYHQLKLVQTEHGWLAEVYVDV